MDAPSDPWVPRAPRRSARADHTASTDVVPGGWFAERLGGRWQLDGRTALALVLAIAVVAAVAGVWMLRGRGAGTPIPAGPTQVTGVPSAVASVAPAGVAVASPSPGASPSAGAPPGAEVRVHVVGQVRRPGVVSLPPGARVEDAVRAAGGATRRADLAAVDLARPVVDGEQIYLSRPGEEPHVLAGSGASSGTGSVAGGVAGSAGAAPVNLNTATAEQLDALPGVGPVLAQRIVQWRQQHGRFSAVDELSEVSGIGDATLEKLRPLVAV